MRKSKSRKAFTIVELVIVIAVIAILATVLVPTFGDVISNAKDSAAKQEAKNAYTQYLVDHAASGNAASYCVYQADANRYVAIDNGSIVGIFDTKEDALAAMVTNPTEELVDAGDGKLFVYGGEAGSGENESSKNAWDTDGDGVFEFLAIGNSFSVDALEYVYQIAQDVGIEKIAIGNLYIGGCSLNTHATNAKNDTAAYTYYFNDSGSWSTNNNYKISTAIQSREWDFVMLQQVSGQSGQADTYNADLDDMIDYVQQRSDAKLVWHMTWAYQQNSTHTDFGKYDKNQMTMYNAIVSAVQNKIVTNSNFDLIVPNGTAVQNSRTSVLGDTTTRDGYHMSTDYGRYLTGLMVVKTVTGLPVDDVAYRPTGVDELEQRIAIDAVNKAAAKPFAVTESAYTTDDFDFSDYELLDINWYLHGYWNSSDNKNKHSVLINAANNTSTNHPQYFTTPYRLSKTELPVGSIIVVEDGWQYRPDGWVDGDQKLQSTRPDNVKEQFVVVTEEWWGNYTLRAFNVSKIAGGNVTQAEMDAGKLKIYVPKGYLENLDFSDYELLDMDWYLHGYWYCTGNPYNTLISDGSKSKQYFTTPYRLSKKELPVGSIIVVEDGWQYRPDGWVDGDQKLQSTRPGNTSEQFVVVTEEWWGDYTLRAFNVSKIAGGDVTQEEMDAGKLKIYVPKN